MARVKNEIVPLQTRGEHSSTSVERGRAVVYLASRKNAPHGAEIARQCTCSARPSRPCGVCALGAVVQEHRDACRGAARPLFGGKSFSARTADLHRRAELLKLTAKGQPRVGWHAFRRGHAQDMLASGTTLSQILTAGGWKSMSFLAYLCRKDVDERASLEAAFAQSDSDVDD